VPSPSTYDARSSASAIPVPDSFTTGVRIHSSVEILLPSGTARVPSSSRRMCTGAAATISSLSASSWILRVSVTSRDNVDSPGSSTRFSISHSTARSNSSRRESRVIATREAMNAVTSASASSAKSRNPSRSRISQACSYRVCARSAYAFTHDGSSTPSCSAA